MRVAEIWRQQETFSLKKDFTIAGDFDGMKKIIVGEHIVAVCKGKLRTYKIDATKTISNEFTLKNFTISWDYGVCGGGNKNGFIFCTGGYDGDGR